MPNIYTRTGDKGTTGLYGGSRVDKDSLNVDVYGTIDEAISVLGFAYSQVETTEIKEYISHIQKRMFQAGAEFASDQRGIEMLKDKISDADIKYLEDIIDRETELNGPMREFVIPGVNPSSAALHVARTVVRAQEAEIAEIKEQVKKIVEESFGRKGEFGMDIMSLDNLKKMAGYVEEKANEIGVPMVFTVVDEGGNLVYFQRMPGSLLISIKVSQDKAYTAVSLKCPTAALADVTKPGDSLWSLHNSGDGRIICFGGGYPIEVDGKVIGAIGVSGGTAEEDMSVATYALEKMRGGNA